MNFDRNFEPYRLIAQGHVYKIEHFNNDIINVKGNNSKLPYNEVKIIDMSDLDLKSLHENNSKLDVDFTISNLNSKLFKVDRFDLENCKFYFLDFFDEPLYFDFC